MRPSAALRERLGTRAWPGNVREVEGAVEHAALFARGAKEVGMHRSRLSRTRTELLGRDDLAAWPRE